jgi:hypothetical protein
METKTITGDRTAIPVAKVLNYRGDLALNHDWARHLGKIRN